MYVKYVFSAILIFVHLRFGVTQENPTSETPTTIEAETSTPHTSAPTTEGSTTERILRPEDLERYSFNVTEEAVALRKAIEGVGTNEDSIIRILTTRSYAQRIPIFNEYHRLYKTCLKADLASDLSGDFGEFIQGLLDHPSLYAAKQVHKALTGLKIDYTCLNQIITVGDKHSLENLLEKYKNHFNKTLIETLNEKLSGDILNFYQLVISKPIKNRYDVFQESVIIQLKYVPLPNGTVLNATRLMHIFAKEADEHLRHLCFKYEMKYSPNGPTNITVEESLAKAFQEPLLSAYVSRIKYIKSPPHFYAHAVQEAFKGLGTDENALNRLMIAPREIENTELRVTYFYTFDKTLRDAIKEETSGYYQTALLNVVGGEKLFKEGQAE